MAQISASSADSCSVSGTTPRMLTRVVQITRHSSRKVWWTCDKCPDSQPHEWEARVDSRTNGASCPFCANKRPCQHNSLATKAPAVAVQFSFKNKGTPHDYMVSSNQKVIWQCHHGHEWIARIGSRTGKYNKGCPACFNIRKSSQPKKQHPALIHSKHPMMQRWDWDANAKAGLDPSQITCRSAVKANWICPCCPKGQPHRWQARVGHMYAGGGCPCCSGHKACICNSLQSLFPEVAAELDYSQNEGTPSEYSAFSHAKVWWQNDMRGNFHARIGRRTHALKQLHDS